MHDASRQATWRDFLFGAMRRTILTGVPDLIFRSKVAEVARHLGFEVTAARTRGALLDAARRDAPVLVILDLTDPRVEAGQTIRDLKADRVLARIPVLGFHPHVDVAARAEALEAGCDRVVTRLAFAGRLAAYVRDMVEDAATCEGRSDR